MPVNKLTVTEKRVVRMFSPWQHEILKYRRKLHIAVRIVESGLQSTGWVQRAKKHIQSFGNEISCTTSARPRSLGGQHYIGP